MKRRSFLPKSIRWRLPLSYASIALITAVVLGVMLVSALRVVYRERERAYLNQNARLISASLADLLAAADTPPEALTAQVTSFAYLTQSRVRLFDTQGEVLADSGQPNHLFVIRPAFPAEAAAPLSPAAPESPVILIPGPDLAAAWETLEVLRSRSESTRVAALAQVEVARQAVEAATTEATRQAAELRLFEAQQQAAALEAQVEAALAEAELRMELAGQRLERAPVAPEIGRMYGLGSMSGFDERGGEHRVTATVQQSTDSTVLGYVELSGGPDYGRYIVAGVALAWLPASAMAVLIAAFIGWLVSRRMSAPLLALTGVTTRMAEGELSARATVTRQDEFGTLALAFNEMAGQVEVTVETLRRFVADAAHELNTPLTALRNNLDLALEETDAAEQRVLLKHGRSQVKRLEELMRSLLNLSRLEAKATSAAPVPINLTTLLLKTSEPYASRAEQKAIDFVLNVPDQPIWVVGDEAQLRQAVGNLIDNAVKFACEGGEVTVSLNQNHDWATFIVTDTGIGIPDEELPHLFNRFHRGRNAAAYPGSGLGLAIVKAVAEAHGGQVSAENGASGTRFSLKLPLGRHEA